MSIERHHLAFPRTAWESSIPSKKLRQMPQHIVPMDAEIEHALHKAIITIPLLDYYTASHALKELQPSKTYVGSIYNLMNAIERASHHPKTHPTEYQVAQLTVHALQEQLPFIRMGQLTSEVGGTF